MSERKTCPFCGEEEMLRPVISVDRPGVQSGFVECVNCGARGQVNYGSCSPDEMLELVWSGWNTRANPEDTTE